MNQQRMAIYSERDYILYSENISQRVEEIISDVSDSTIKNISSISGKNINPIEIIKWFNSYSIGIDEEAVNKAFEGGIDNAIKNITNLLIETYRKKATLVDEKVFREVEKNIFLSVIENR